MCKRSKKKMGCVFKVLLIFAFFWQWSCANEAARRLFDDLLSNYNKLVRPVHNHSETLTVQIRLRLSQLLDVVKMNDSKLIWNPEEYEDIDMLYIPANLLWTPDIVLYNTAGGHYEVRIMTKAQVRYWGEVIWEPPAVYHSMCEMNVMWFPFDQQECKMKFGAWSNDGYQVDLIHYNDKNLVKEFTNEFGQQVWRVEDGINLDGYHPHVEWEILEVPGERHFIRYPCCEAPFVDVTYYLILRRKKLFYIVNLMIPCIGISMLTVFVFYLPADSGEKIVMCISILIALNALFLLLVEIIPPTSIVMPLIARYLLFTMVMVTLSVAVTVVTLSIHYRGPSTHRMPWIIKHIFLERLPPILGMRKPVWALNTTEDPDMDLFGETPFAVKRKSLRRKPKIGRERRRTMPLGEHKPENDSSVVVANCRDRNCVGSSVSVQLPKVVVNLPSVPDATDSEDEKSERSSSRPLVNRGIRKSMTTGTFMPHEQQSRLIVDVWERRESLMALMHDRDEAKKAIFKHGDRLSAIRYVASSVALIAHKIRREAKEKEIIESWSYVGMVIDRLFLFIFSIACIVGTCSIVLQAPSLYDTRKPIGEPNQ